MYGLGFWCVREWANRKGSERWGVEPRGRTVRWGRGLRCSDCMCMCIRNKRRRRRSIPPDCALYIYAACLVCPSVSALLCPLSSACSAQHAHGISGSVETEADSVAARRTTTTTTTAAQPSPQPYFWQVPRNQLTLLAGLGRRVSLAFLDLDEYLVLPAGSGGIGGSAAAAAAETATSGGGAGRSGGNSLLGRQCKGRPLLLGGGGAGINLGRYPALLMGCAGDDELECWERVAFGLVSDGGGGAHAPAGPTLRVTQCPCQLGKTVVQPQQVINTRVHKSIPLPGQHMHVMDVRCGYVLHLQALISSKRPWAQEWDNAPRNDTLLLGDWLRGGSGSSSDSSSSSGSDSGSGHGGAGWFAAAADQPPIMSASECVRSRRPLLQRCNQG